MKEFDLSFLEENPYIFYNEKTNKFKCFSELGSLVKEIKPKAENPSRELIEKVLTIAESERLIGGQDFKETEGSNAGPQVKKYLAFCGLPEGNPWCASFISWVVSQAGKKFCISADTWELESYAIAHSILSDSPERGDIFLQYGTDGRPKHTGFVRKIDPLNTNFLLTIEGNAGDSIKNCNDKKVSECKYIKWWK